MRFLRPLEISPSGYTSTAPTDRSAPLWSATTSVTAVGGGSAGLPSFALLTYQPGDEATYGGSVYQATVANTGHPPPQYPTEWAVIGSANDFAMFDSVGGTSTFASGSLTVSVQIHTRSIDAVAIIGVLAASVSLTVGGQTRTASLAGGYAETLLFEGLTGATGSTATLTLTGGDLSIKAMLLGNMYTLGETVYGGGLEFVDYSRKDTDAFGNETLIKRAYSNRLNASVKVPSTIRSEAVRAIASVRATPTYWEASGSEEMLRVYGYVKDFRPLVDYPTISTFGLTVEGMSGGDSPTLIGAGAVSYTETAPAPAPAPITTTPLRASRGYVQSPNSSLTLNLPTGTLEGDMLVAIIGVDTVRAITITPPADWTLAASNQTIVVDGLESALFYKIATAVDVSGPAQFTFSYSNSNTELSGEILSITGPKSLGAAYTGFKAIDNTGIIGQIIQSLALNSADTYTLLWVRHIDTSVANVPFGHSLPDGFSNFTSYTPPWSPSVAATRLVSGRSVVTIDNAATALELASMSANIVALEYVLALSHSPTPLTI